MTRYLELRKEVERFKENWKLLKETFLNSHQIELEDFSGVLTRNFIPTKSEEPLEKILEELYIMYNTINERIVKDLFFQLNKIMKDCQKNDNLLVGKLYYTSEELEHFEKLFNHIAILIEEIQVPPCDRIGLFFMAEDTEIIPQFEKLINQLDSAYKAAYKHT